MKITKLALSILFLIAFPLGAHATSVTFTIEGEVAGLDSQLLPGPIQAGDPFIWSLIYDDQTPDLDSDPTRQLYIFSSSTLNIGNGDYVASHTVDAFSLSITSSGHHFSILSVPGPGAGSLINSYEYRGTNFSLNNVTGGTPLTGIDLTSLNALSIGDFPTHSAFSSFGYIGSGPAPGFGGSTTFVRYNIANLSFSPSASPVPEPSTSLLLAAGVLGLCLTRFFTGKRKTHAA